MATPHVTWSWNINLGQVLAAAAMLSGLAAAYTRIESTTEDHDRRILALEAVALRVGDQQGLQAVQNARIDGRLARLEEMVGDVRSEMRDMARRAEP